MDDSRWHRWRMKAFLFVMGFTRGMTLGTRGILVDGERVFLIRHTYVAGWHFPGGGVEPGESVEQALGRELMEEGGYRLTRRPELLGFYHNTLATRRDHVACFVCRQFEQARPFASNREIAEAGWFDRGKLPPDATDATRRRLAELFDGTERSENW